jgi:recombinational DNA repair protein (RecF pathway)
MPYISSVHFCMHLLQVCGDRRRVNVCCPSGTPSSTCRVHLAVQEQEVAARPASDKKRHMQGSYLI